METKALADLLRGTCNVELFSSHSAYEKPDAQRNLMGRTHYVDDDTLRFHKARILGRGVLADGLLFYIVESVAKDYENTSRGARVVLFDLFGRTIHREELDMIPARQETARKRFWDWYGTFDVIAYYKEVLGDRQARKLREAAELEQAIAQIN